MTSNLKRRRFLQSIAGAPAAAALLPKQTLKAQSLPAQQGRPAPPEVPKLETASPDAVGDTIARYFSPLQFATLRRLGELFQPPAAGGFPGALEAGAPEFLDFLIAKSPADRQKLYKGGLDALNLAARKKHTKDFAGLDAAQADAIVKPLLVVWNYEPPKDPLVRFVAEVHEDFRTATVNSPEWAKLANASASRRRGGGSGLFFNKID